MARRRNYLPAAVPPVRVASLFALCGAGPVAAQSAGAAQAPFGDKVSERIPSYDRAAPQVATSAPLERLGILEAKGVGFRSIVDLQPSPEASAAEQTMAEFALLRYHNLPIAEDLPSDDEIAAFADLIEAPENQPVLVHGARSEEHTSELQSLMRISYAVFCLKKKKQNSPSQNEIYN